MKLLTVVLAAALASVGCAALAGPAVRVESSPSQAPSAASSTDLASDPRALQCLADKAPTLAIFEIASGAEFLQHFPAAGKAPEMLAQTEPILVVVFKDGWPGPVLPAPGSSPGHRTGADVCTVFSDGHMNVYETPLDGFSP